MSAREEFITFSLNSESSIGLLCRRFGISRKTGYKWLDRFRRESTAGLSDRSRRSHSSPRRSSEGLEQKVIALRRQHRSWGGRKIKRRLEDLGEKEVCSVGTVTAILRRHDLIDPLASNSGIGLHGKRYGIGKAFRGQRVGLRATAIDGIWDVYYCRQRVGSIDERTSQPMNRKPANPLATLAQMQRVS
jgi:transposase-like protein